MQELIHDVEEEKLFSLDILLSYPDLDQLPREFFTKLPEYCDKILKHIEKIESLLTVTEEEDMVTKDIEVACIQSTMRAYLSTPSLYRSDVQLLGRSPSFKKYQSILNNDFFFI